MAAGSPSSAAPKKAAPIGVPLVGGARLPLAFITCGLTAFAIGVSWLAVDPSVLIQPHLHPRVIALVHLWLPGFLLSVSLGAFYQLMPVVLGAPLQSGNVGIWAHFTVHAIGLGALISGFLIGSFALVGIGGALVATGILFQAVIVLRTFLIAPRRDAAAWSFPLATAWLVATVLVGVLLALNRHGPFLTLSTVHLLRAHAHLGLAGFFLTLLQGATFQLVPMFTMGSAQRPRFIWGGLLATQLGLLVLAPGLAWGLRLPILLGACALALGVGASGVAFVSTLQQRRRRSLEPGLRAFVIGACLLAASAAMGLVLVAAPAEADLLRLISAYGVILIIGALSLMILGMLCKIVPFLVWMRAYGPKVGKQPVPAAPSLSSKYLESTWLVGHVLALALVIIACVLSSEIVALAGAWLLAAATTCYLFNIGRVLTHLRTAKSRTGTLPLAAL